MSSTGASPGLPPPKQIRFVNNEGQPPAKRRRINAAYVHSFFDCVASRVTTSDHSVQDGCASTGPQCMIVAWVYVHLLKEFYEYRCRTCRKRKTRCDGKRPLCSTCTENGHECLGYADVGEGKKESRASDLSRNADEDIDDEDEDKSTEGTGLLDNGHQVFLNGSPDLRRTDSQSYFTHTAAPKGRRETADMEKRSMPSFGNDYRESAVFSDDGPSPMGMEARQSEQFHTLTARSSDRSPPLHAESHRVPYFRYFGPTAIVPGFKQMVVSVREHRRSTGAGSVVACKPLIPPLVGS